MKGYTQLLIAKSQAQAALAEPRLAFVRNMLVALSCNVERAGLPPHIVERELDSMDRLIAIVAEHGGLVK